MNPDNVYDYFPMVLGMMMGKNLLLSKCSHQWEKVGFLDTKWAATDFKLDGADDEFMYNLMNRAMQIIEECKAIKSQQ